MTTEQKKNGTTTSLQPATSVGGDIPGLVPTQTTSTEAIQKIAASLMINGDLSKLNDQQKAKYLLLLCDKYGLDPATKPFQIIKAQGKEIPYLTKGGAEQLSKMAGLSISVEHLGPVKIGEFEVYVVRARATKPDNSFVESEGAVPTIAKNAEDAANIIMKAACVPVSYEILTQTGFVDYQSLKIGELVASYNTQNMQVEWVPLLDVQSFPAQKTTTYGSNSTQFTITPGHSFVKVDQNLEVASLVEFEKFGDHDHILLAAAETQTPSKNQYAASLLGWIVTDGNVRDGARGKRSYICQSKEENFSMIEDAIRGFFGEERVTRGVTNNRERGWKDQHFWYFNQSQTAKIFETFQFKSNKDLPRIAAQMGDRDRKAMLAAMMAADGDKRGTFQKTKRDVVDAFQILSSLNGIATSKETHDLPKYRKMATKTLIRCRQFKHQKIVKKYLEPSDGPVTDVWCPSTKNGTWITRTDKGQIMITGNTKARRRAIIAIAGLGMPAEDELDTIPHEKVVIREGSQT